MLWFSWKNEALSSVELLQVSQASSAQIAFMTVTGTGSLDLVFVSKHAKMFWNLIHDSLTTRAQIAHTGSHRPVKSHFPELTFASLAVVFHRSHSKELDCTGLLSTAVCTDKTHKSRCTNQFVHASSLSLFPNQSEVLSLSPWSLPNRFRHIVQVIILFPSAL